jgi:hypothetical protein
MANGDEDYIMTCLVDEWINTFKQKRQDYQDAHRELGVKAQFVDINRKVVKLRRSMWEGHELVGEQPREILMDLIGHCFLAIDLLDEEVRPK